MPDWLACHDHGPMRGPRREHLIATSDARATRLEEFERLFRENYEALCRFAFRFLRNAAGAEDVVQEAFSNLWTAGEHVVIRTSARAYLYAAVRNKSLNLCKHAAVVAAWERDAAREAEDIHPATADEGRDLPYLSTRLAEAFAALPPRQAEAMRLRWHEDMTHAEIADALGISVKGVEKHLARGLAALRSALLSVK